MCVCLLHCLHVRFHNGYTQAYAQIKQHTHIHKAVDVRVKATKLLSHRRQSDYSTTVYIGFALFSVHLCSLTRMHQLQEYQHI